MTAAGAAAQPARPLCFSCQAQSGAARNKYSRSAFPPNIVSVLHLQTSAGHVSQEDFSVLEDVSPFCETVAHIPWGEFLLTCMVYPAG